MKLILSYSIPICAVLFISITLAYTKTNYIMVKLDSMLSNRLSQGKIGIEKYGLTPYGHYITMHGYGGLKGYEKDFTSYFYIDSSYLKIALLFGSLLLLFLCISYVFFCRKRIRNDDILLPVIILIIAIDSMIEQHMVDFAYNPFIFVFMANLSEESQNIDIGETFFRPFNILYRINKVLRRQ